MIKAVLFDMDGVLLDTEQLYAKTLTDIMRELGYEMNMSFFISTLGVPNRACLQLYYDSYGNDFPFEMVYKRMFAAVQEHIKTHGTPLKSGVEACLTALKAQGLKLVLATSCPRFAVDNYFRTLPQLEQLLDDKVCGDEVTKGKPDPEIFLKAARLAGEPPAACLGVEDSRSGLMGIRASGAYAVMIPDLLPFSDALSPFADDVLESLNGLPELIGRLNQR
jgi:HAD superfamily hydrolase (TIGR01509 family)